MSLSSEEGKVLIKMARDAIRVRLNSFDDKSFTSEYSKFEEKFDNLVNIVLKQNDISKEKIPEFLNNSRGVFVTLNKGINLRGCIGLPETEKPLYNAVVEAAIGAAFGDPRFPKLTTEELHEVNIDISVLTLPRQESNEILEDFLNGFKLGEDGIIVRGIYGSALLLPQVATEHAMDKVEFLEAVCVKAGLSKDTWKDQETKIFKFQAQVFRECEH